MAVKVVAAAWSVLATLAIGQSARGIQSNYLQQFILTSSDSQALYDRLSIAPAGESFKGIQILAKRYSSTDGSIRIDCAVAKLGINPVACAVSIDTSKSAPGLTVIQPGFVPKSIVFQFNSKADVSYLLQNLIGTRGEFDTAETVLIKSSNGQLVSVPRFRLGCPPDWVFDVVSCNGYVILR